MVDLKKKKKKVPSVCLVYQPGPEIIIIKKFEKEYPFTTFHDCGVFAEPPTVKSEALIAYLRRWSAEEKPNYDCGMIAMGWGLQPKSTCTRSNFPT